MRKKQSTFDQLANSLSKEETQKLLNNIRSNMEGVDSGVTEVTKESPTSSREKSKAEKGFADESFFLRLWLSIKSFLRSTPIDDLYNEQLLKRLSSYLKKIASDFILVNRNVYTTKFYEHLKALRATQLFFSSILTSYDSTKGHFYMLLSSFTTPVVYENLMKETDPFFVKVGTEVSSKMRTTLLRKIDNIFSNMNDSEKAVMYKAAKALEWMRAFCSLSLDKTLLRFSSVAGAEMESPVLTIQPEIEMLCSILTSKKVIPDDLLQTMFLLHSQEKMIDDESKMRKEADEFIKEAIASLQNIKNFMITIPIIDITRYVKKDINWQPYNIEGGEDWFVYFKQAWYERFDQKWSNWSYEQKKYNLKMQMMNLLKVDDLENLKFFPWKNLWIECTFKKEMEISFLKTFFNLFYRESIADTLKVVLVEGSFYKRESLNEYTTSYNILQNRKSTFAKYEERLSPVGDIGSAFAKIRSEKIATLKNKTKIEALMRSVESEASQIIDDTIEALKSIGIIITGILGESTNSNAASLTNLSSIQSLNNSKFREQIAFIKEKINSLLDLHNRAEKLEAEM